MCVHNAVLEGEIIFAEPQLITHYCSVISMKGSSMLKIKMYLLHPPGVLAFSMPKIFSVIIKGKELQENTSDTFRGEIKDERYFFYVKKFFFILLIFLSSIYSPFVGSL